MIRRTEVQKYPLLSEACREEHSPVILQVSQDVLENHTYYKKLVEAALIECADIPIVWHLDHGSSFEVCKFCIDGGYSSVMIDGSSLPFEENIALTRRVVEYAHHRGVVVEAELGALAGVEDDVNVGGGCIFSNFRHDAGEIRMPWQGSLQQTGTQKLGCLVGAHSRIGCKCVILPGRVLPPGTCTYPGMVYTGSIGE